MTPGVFVGIPCVDWMWTKAALAQRHLLLPPGSRVEFPEGATTLVHKRNFLAESFLEDERLSHILMLDSDMIPPRNTVRRLLAHNLPIVGALYFQRISPFCPCAGWFPVPGQPRRFLTETGGREPLQQVDWIGTGCLLISRDVLLKVPKPWFEWIEPGVGEDTWFCKQATKAGIPIHVDTGLCVGHVGVMGIGLDFVTEWREMAAAREQHAAAQQVSPGRDHRAVVQQVSAVTSTGELTPSGPRT